MNFQNSHIQVSSQNDVADVWKHNGRSPWQIRDQIGKLLDVERQMGNFDQVSVGVDDIIIGIVIYLSTTSKRNRSTVEVL